MDAMGDGTEIGDDEWVPPESPWTPEARVFTAIGLVLASMFTIGLFQALVFWVDPGGMSSRTNGIVYTVPTGVLAGAGAYLGWSARRAPRSEALRGVAMSAAVVGGVVALVGAAGLVAVLAADPRL